MVKIGNVLGPNFQGHEEEAMQLLLQVDSVVIRFSEKYIFISFFDIF